MKRIAFSVAALAAILCYDIPASHAQSYGGGPWCAVTETGAGGVERDCIYSSAAECAPSVISGNRGFCQMNPYWGGAPGPWPRYRHHYRRHYRHYHH